MCGRYANTRSSVDLAALFDATDETGGDLAPDYNIAPTDPVPIVRAGGAGRVLSVARWGFCPPWARSGGPSGGVASPSRGAAPRRYAMINARAETVEQSRAFAAAYRTRRALVPADGWYEWRRQGGQRQAYYMTPRDGEPLVFAGLWSPGPDGEPTCAVLTVAAVGELRAVHDRMPLLLGARDWAGWLSGAAGHTAALAPAYPGLEVRPVGRAVGDVRNDGPQLIERISGVPSVDLGGQQATMPLF